jgi:8-hydroxy-5-deazaflavin:NADPH oxidoreductase
VQFEELSAARGLEMYLPLWVRLMARLGTAAFNVKVVR